METDPSLPITSDACGGITSGPPSDITGCPAPLRTAPADASVRIVSGALEGSNVNVADTMVRMIELSRQFDMHMKTLRTVEENARNSASLMRLG
jgi:flagellar basal body rod protein FlgG